MSPRPIEIAFAGGAILIAAALVGILAFGGLGAGDPATSSRTPDAAPEVAGGAASGPNEPPVVPRPTSPSTPIARPAPVDPGLLDGSVESAHGEPVPAKIDLLAGPTGDPLAAETSFGTAEDGRFRAKAPEGPGRYVLRVDAGPGWAARVVTATTGFRCRVVVGVAGRIAGRIVDAAGDPVAGEVEGLGEDWSGHATAGADGMFILESVAPGRVRLAAAPEPATGRQPGQTTATVVAGATTEVTIAVSAGARIAGTVLSPSESRPVAGAVVRAANDGDLGRSLETKTDAGGRFALAGLPPGEATVVVHTASGASAGPFAVELPDTVEPVEVELVLGAAGEVRARVESEAGDPLPAVEGSLAPVGRRGDAGEARRTITDASGALRFPGVPAGTWTLTAVRGAARAETLISVGAGRGSDAHGEPLRSTETSSAPVLVLPEVGALRGTVTRNDGSPAGGAALTASGPWGSATSTADADGVFELAGVPIGPVSLSGRAQGTGVGALEATIAPDRPTEVRLVLPDAAWITGTVRDGRGGPLPRASIRVTGRWGERTATTDGQGQFAATGLGPSPYRVEGWAPDHRPAARDGVGEGEVVDLVLTAEARISGTVTGPDGARVELFVVSIDDGRDERALAEAVFDGGRFELALPEGGRVMRVRADRLAPAVVTIPEGGGELAIRLEPGAPAHGRVTDAAGAPLPGAAILRGRVREEELDSPTSFADLLAVTEMAGDFAIEGVPEEGIEVTISHPEHAPIFARLTPGDVGELILPPGGRIEGRTTEPFAPVLVTGPVVRRTTSDASGAFAVGGLAEGVYQVAWVRSDGAGPAPGDDEETVAAASAVEVTVRAGATARVTLR